MMGRRFSKLYLGTIWLLLSLGTVLYLVDLAEQLAEQRVALEAALQEDIDASRTILDETTATWTLRTDQAQTVVDSARGAVNEFITPENPEPYGWYFRRAQEELEMAQAQLAAIAEASEEEIAALNKTLAESTANKPAELARFDSEEALQVKDWGFAFSGLLLGAGLLLFPVSSAQPNGGEHHRPEPPPDPAAVSAPVMRDRGEEPAEEDFSELELEPIEDDY